MTDANIKKPNVVVMSGGLGSRLWPASRLDHPKPFIKLNDGSTLIHNTYCRVKDLFDRLITVTNVDYYQLSTDTLNNLGIKSEFLLEPLSKNTAPAVALVTKYLNATEKNDPIVFVVPSDHLISDDDAFSRAVLSASKLASEGYLVTFGVKPTSPETGYGYIKAGKELSCGYIAQRFYEKPTIDVARGFLESDQFYWNTGILCFSAKVLLQELADLAPELYAAVDNCWKSIQIPLDASPLKVPMEVFSMIPDVSIDHALLEKSGKVAIIPAEFTWNDLGSWNALMELTPPDARNNRVNADAVLVDTYNVMIDSNRLVATVGVSDLVIADTPDALLVSHQNSTQRVKEVVKILKERRHESVRLHTTVVRPWGSYTVLDHSSRYKIKRIVVNPKASLSLQMHHHRSEHWVVVSGSALVINGESRILIQSNQSSYIPAGQRHRLENPGVIPCVMIEVQCGDYLGEDDIVRFEDNYGRQ